MSTIGKILGIDRKKVLIGMVHVGALPGTPFCELGLDEIERVAVEEAKVLAGAGFDAIIIENMHDRPYVHGGHGPETVAAMTRVGLAVRAATDLPLGVQVLSGGNCEAIAVAHAVGGRFIRCENFVFAHVADEGLLERAEAGGLLRYRRKIGAEGVAVLCDIKKKHASHAITADLGIGEMVHGAAFFGADGYIVTGVSTGCAVDAGDLREGTEAARRVTGGGGPVLVGSGVTATSAAELLAEADGLIVGSWLKKDGVWTEPIDEERCCAIVQSVAQVRGW